MNIKITELVGLHYKEFSSSFYCIFFKYFTSYIHCIWCTLYASSCFLSFLVCASPCHPVSEYSQLQIVSNQHLLLTLCYHLLLLFGWFKLTVTLSRGLKNTLKHTQTHTECTHQRIFTDI